MTDTSNNSVSRDIATDRQPDAKQKPSCPRARDLGPVGTGTELSAISELFREHPHEVLDDLRLREPVHEDRAFDRIVLTRADDVRSILFDRSLASDPRKSRPGSFTRLQFGVDEAFRPTMLHLDDPDHKRLRDLVSQAFNQRSVDAMRPWIVGMVADLLDEAARKGSFDVIADFAQPLTVGVIARILGVQSGDRAAFAAWSDAQMHMFNPARTPEQTDALKWGEAEICRYLTTAVARHKNQPQEGLIGELVNAEQNGDQLTETEVVDTCRMLLVAGNVTTRDLIGNGVVALLNHPKEIVRLREEPNRIAAIVEEVLRFDAPVVQAARQTVAEHEIGGCPVAAGRSVVAMLMAANHDPALHADPHAFDVDRVSKRHFAFGGGAHFCLGAPLALLEGQVAIAALFERIPSLRLLEPDALRRKSMPSMNGFEAVWVEAGARAKEARGHAGGERR